MSKLTPGVIYELLLNTDEYLKGSRWEFISGKDDDVFCDGLRCEYFSSDEVRRSPDQGSLGFSEEMQYNKARCLSGHDQLI